jgi:UDP-N-acetylmuramoyl-L-alanyl-D-glutamate--2,6-diaminopimelate ligase
MGLTFGELLRNAEPALAVELGTVADRPVVDVAYDSRRARPGSVFCCLPGGRHDGHEFAAAAVAAGSELLVVERPLGLGVPEVVVVDARATMGRLAAALAGHPSDRVRLVGVTGTNGKTTTVHVLAQVLEHAGWPSATVGTLSGGLTTPEAPELQRLIAQHADEGKQAVVMEVSSHALALSRVEGCHFAVGIFTNLGRDHLDFHGTEERYFAAKARLFEPGRCAHGVVNRDDLHGRLLLDAAPIPMTSYGIDDLADVVVAADRHCYTWRSQRICVPIGAHFNVMNTLAAATAAEVLGLEPEQIAEGLAGVTPVPGRFEAVDAGQPFHVVVDYAHTPDGLRGVLGAARELAVSGKVLVVFGCGGDRDREKRPEMGAAATELADVVVITSDNPRSEDPQQIIDAVQAGVPDRYRDRLVATTPDRREGIATVLRLAEPGDVVVIAGKGHESTQTIGSEVVAFDDRVEARRLLEDLT